MRIKDLSRMAYENAKAKGFHRDNDDTQVGTRLMLIVSELAEAMEEHRKGKGANEVYYVDGKPEGVPVELADALISICDFSHKHGIDLEAVVMEKMEYNSKRPFMHGKIL